MISIPETQKGDTRLYRAVGQAGCRLLVRRMPAQLSRLSRKLVPVLHAMHVDARRQAEDHVRRAGKPASAKAGDDEARKCMTPDRRLAQPPDEFGGRPRPGAAKGAE
jgi:hypothetical protein